MDFDIGCAMIQEMLNIRYLSDMCGVEYQRLSNGMSRTIRHGNSVKLRQEEVDRMNEALLQIAEYINKVEITTEDTRAQMKVLSKQIKMPYLMMKVMGKSEAWMKRRMSQKPSVKEYKEFNEQDVNEINLALQQVSTKLASFCVNNHPDNKK